VTGVQTCALPICTAAEYLEIDSPHGHDGFLINLDEVAPPIQHFLENLGK
jgi:homoserine O-acetyltransferase